MQYYSILSGVTLTRRELTQVLNSSGIEHLSADELSVLGYALIPPSPAGVDWRHQASEWRSADQLWIVTERDSDVVKAELVESVKDDAAQKILSIAPDWRQRNLIARGASLANKVAVGSATTADVAEIAAIDAVFESQINPIRDASNVIEAAINAALDGPAAVAAATTGVWPEVND